MASVAKWLRQWIVVPPLVGSSPIVRPFASFNTVLFQADEFACLFSACIGAQKSSHQYDISGLLLKKEFDKCKIVRFY